MNTSKEIKDKNFKTPYDTIIFKDNKVFIPKKNIIFRG